MRSNVNSHRPKKSLGQNFLIDQNYQKKIVAAVQEYYESQTLIEIGPGPGSITDHLILFAKKLILIEKDNELAAHLKEKYKEYTNVKVISEDVLKINWAELCGDNSDSIVVGNLPYNISSQILIGLLENSPYFSYFYFMFQKEVALRCVAGPRSKDYGVLALWCQLFTKPERLFDLPASVFRPRPKVVSSLVKFKVIPATIASERGFISFFKALFSQRRKKISSVLKKMKGVTPNFDHLNGEELRMIDARPETLNLAQLKQIYSVTKVS